MEPKPPPAALPPAWGLPKGWGERPGAWDQPTYMYQRMQSGMTADGRRWTIVVSREGDPVDQCDEPAVCYNFVAIGMASSWASRRMTGRHPKRYSAALFALAPEQITGFDQAVRQQWFRKKLEAAEAARHWQQQVSASAPVRPDVG